MKIDIVNGGDCHGKDEYKMKNFFKKCMITICTLSVIFSLSTVVFADNDNNKRPMPGKTSSVTDTATKDTSNKTTSAQGGVDEPDNVTSQVTSQSVPAKKYLTKWGGFFWFLLSVVVNFILSCWISNRFYRLAKRNTQGSAEIRALRKDIEEKFASTLVDINEPIIEVENTNENYARNEEGIEMPERKPSVEIDEEEREILGKWDMKRAAAKEAREDDSYEMRRPMAGIRFEDEEAEGADEPSKIEKASNRAKDFLGNIFPFDEQ